MLSTLTPPEFSCADGCLTGTRRPSLVTLAARLAPGPVLSRLIRCGSFSLRPVGSVPQLLSPPHLAAGQAWGCRSRTVQFDRRDSHPRHAQLRWLLQGNCYLLKSNTRKITTEGEEGRGKRGRGPNGPWRRGASGCYWSSMSRTVIGWRGEPLRNTPLHRGQDSRTETRRAEKNRARYKKISVGSSCGSTACKFPLEKAETSV